MWIHIEVYRLNMKKTIPIFFFPYLHRRYKFFSAHRGKLLVTNLKKLLANIELNKIKVIGLLKELIYMGSVKNSWATECCILMNTMKNSGNVRMKKQLGRTSDEGRGGDRKYFY